MAGLPTVTVKLDDVNNGGTFPYDVTSYVHLPSGISIDGHGRPDEFSTVQATTLAVTLDNTDGRFTLGSTSGGYGAINVDRGIKVTFTVSGVAKDRFTGFVQDWAVEWPVDGGNPSNLAQARVTATDQMARLARTKLRTMLENEYLADNVKGMWLLNEAAGSTTFADASGSILESLRIEGSGAALTAGNTSLPNSGLEGMSYCTFVGGSQDQTLLAPVPAVASAADAFVEVVFRAGPTTAGAMIDLFSTNSAGSIRLYMTASQVVAAVTTTDSFGPNATSPLTYGDNAWHHAAAVWSGSAGTVTLWIDGTAVQTSAAVPAGKVLAWDTVRVGNAKTVGLGRWGGALAAAAYGNTVATRMAKAGTAAAYGGNFDNPPQRLERYATYAKMPASMQVMTDPASILFMSQQTMNGSFIQPLIEAVDRSEFGITFIRGDGKLVFHGRAHRANQLTPVFTLTSDDLSPDTGFTTDMQRVFNYAEVSRVNGGTPQIAANAASVNIHGQYPFTASDILVNNSDELPQSMARWLVNTSAEPAGRLGSARIDLLTNTVTVQQALQAAEIGDRFQVTALPSQTPGGTTADLVVEGWSEHLTHDSWEMVLNTSPWARYQAWVLGDATYGVLGTTTRLFF